MYMGNNQAQHHVLGHWHLLVSPVTHRCLRNRAINKSKTAVNIQEHHFDL